MGLKIIVSEARERQSQAIQMSHEANQVIQTLQQSVRNFLSAPLSSKAYDSAKNYFMFAYTLNGKVTHRMFVRNPELNGVPIK